MVRFDVLLRCPEGRLRGAGVPHPPPPPPRADNARFADSRRDTPIQRARYDEPRDDYYDRRYRSDDDHGRSTTRVPSPQRPAHSDYGRRTQTPSEAARFETILEDALARQQRDFARVMQAERTRNKEQTEQLLQQQASDHERALSDTVQKMLREPLAALKQDVTKLLHQPAAPAPPLPVASKPLRTAQLSSSEPSALGDGAQRAAVRPPGQRAADSWLDDDLAAALADNASEHKRSTRVSDVASQASGLTSLERERQEAHDAVAMLQPAANVPATRSSAS
jgi:hypothetical protein